MMRCVYTGEIMLKHDDNHNCEVKLTDGSSVRIHANQLHNKKMDRFQGWNCHAGHDRIYIDVDGSVYGGECMNDRLGTVEDWSLLSEPTVCRLETCTGCTDDLMTNKWRTV